MARKFKRTNVLELLRTVPADLRHADPSSVEDLRCNGLTRSERRALHAHLQDLGKFWRAKAVQDTTTQRKWAGFLDLKRTFQRVLEAYSRHVAQFGPPGHHTYATDDADDSSVACPLRGKQCPLVATCTPVYAIDLGFPDGDVFLDTAVPMRSSGMSPTPFTSLEVTVRNGHADAGEPAALQDGASIDGFQAAAVGETYGASSIWMDPLLLRLRLDVTKLEVAHRVFPLSENGASAPTTEVYTGTWSGRIPVAVKRLVGAGKTLANAAALATACKTFRAMKNPHLVPLVGLEWTKALDLPVVTPWVARGDLRALLDTSDAASLTWSDFKCLVAIHVANALSHLDEQRRRTTGIGAITSRNVLLKPNGTACLNLMQRPCVDLGDARDRVPSPVRYVAPEVVLGGASTTKSDVYALGVLLTELDTTKLPFHDAVNPNGAPMDDMLIAFRMARRSMRPTLSPDCPEAIASLVDECLAQDPEKRPSMTSVLTCWREEAIEQAVSKSGVEVSEAKPSLAGCPPRRRVDRFL